MLAISWSYNVMIISRIAINLPSDELMDLVQLVLGLLPLFKVEPTGKNLEFSKILISCLSLSMPGRKQPCSVSLPLHSITLNWCPTTLALTSISQTSASPCLLPLPPTFSPFWHKHSEVSLWYCHKLDLSSSPTIFYQTLALGGFKGTLLNNVWLKRAIYHIVVLYFSLS